MSKPTVLIASDHAGVKMKQAIQQAFPDFNWMDLGSNGDQKVDYPDFAEKLAKKIAVGAAEMGILICGSGIGMSIAANKVPGVRAAVVENPVSARVAREHNNANVLCLGARFLAFDYACEIVREFLGAEFSEDPRHISRIEKITGIEQKFLKRPEDQ